MFGSLWLKRLKGTVQAIDIVTQHPAETETTGLSLEVCIACHRTRNIEVPALGRDKDS